MFASLRMDSCCFKSLLKNFPMMVGCSAKYSKPCIDFRSGCGESVIDSDLPLADPLSLA